MPPETHKHVTVFAWTRANATCNLHTNVTLRAQCFAGRDGAFAGAADAFVSGAGDFAGAAA